jgi:GrpB-like predicted nucleotidyltransferase (UPF0157 family)
VADEVELVAYDPAWPELYAAEIARVLAVLPAGLVVAATHFGSTAIPGMIAKPVIDMLLAVRALAEARAAAVGPLEGLGYAYWADNPKPDRLFFVRGLPPAPRRTHHVHMCLPDGQMWRRLAFADALRADPAEAARYAALKRQLATRFREDREAYSEAKTGYVDAVLARTGQGG